MVASENLVDVAALVRNNVGCSALMGRFHFPLELGTRSWIERPQRESSATRMASISRARAIAMTFLRSGRSAAAPDAVSLNTATIL
jgi:hypothetical protein